MHIMKTMITTIIVAALAAISFSLAESADSPSKPETTPAATLQRIHDEWEQRIHRELERTRVELGGALTRIAALEKQVGSLKKANAKLEQEVRSLGKYRLVPLERK